MSEKRNFALPVAGGSSLLVIFAVLCLTVFALLSLSTVLANERLNQASVDAISAYYEADCQAEEIFAELRNGQMPQGVTENAGIYSYSCPISELQELQVELQNREGVWTVLRWQSVSTAEYQDNTLSVWDGEAGI